MKQKIDCNWHKYVDLGLPSGLLWATCNIGAKEPWESGLYFSWGNVDGHAKGSGYYFSETEYETTSGTKLIRKIPVKATYDAARASFGGSWRMPTASEFQELDDICINEWTTQNGVNGMLFTSKINSNSVFFPATGIYFGTMLNFEGVRGTYWSSSLDLYSQIDAYSLLFVSGCVYRQYYYSRSIGSTIRPILDHPKDSLLIRTIKR